ncbi:unnamed protein product [Penicillium viridicatum]
MAQISQNIRGASFQLSPWLSVFAPTLVIWNRCVLTKAIRDYMDERKWIRAPLAFETLHPMTRLWLTRKEFAKDEDISLLREKGGWSLSNAVLVLLQVAPRRPLWAHSADQRNHSPEFKIEKAQLEAVRDLCCQLSKNLPIDYDHPSDGLIQNVKSREEDLEYDVGEANVLERENLESSRIYVDDHGTFTLVVEIPITPRERKKLRACALDRNFTVEDKTREELLHGRKYLGTRRGQGMFVVTIHSCIQLLLLPRGISQPGSFYTNDYTTLISAKEFNSRKKRKIDAPVDK